MTVRRNQPARNPREGVLQNLKKKKDTSSSCDCTKQFVTKMTEAEAKIKNIYSSMWQQELYQHILKQNWPLLKNSATISVEPFSVIAFLVAVAAIFFVYFSRHWYRRIEQNNKMRVVKEIFMLVTRNASANSVESNIGLLVRMGGGGGVVHFPLLLMKSVAIRSPKYWHLSWKCHKLGVKYQMTVFKIRNWYDLMFTDRCRSYTFVAKS